MKDEEVNKVTRGLSEIAEQREKKQKWFGQPPTFEPSPLLEASRFAWQNRSGVSDRLYYGDAALGTKVSSQRQLVQQDHSAITDGFLIRREEHPQQPPKQLFLLYLAQKDSDTAKPALVSVALGKSNQNQMFHVENVRGWRVLFRNGEVYYVEAPDRHFTALMKDGNRTIYRRQEGAQIAFGHYDANGNFEELMGDSDNPLDTVHTGNVNLPDQVKTSLVPYDQQPMRFWFDQGVKGTLQTEAPVKSLVTHQETQRKYREQLNTAALMLQALDPTVSKDAALSMLSSMGKGNGANKQKRP